MDKKTLVGRDLVVGRRVVEALDGRGTPVDVAAWLQDDETGTWRLLISSPSVAKLGSKPVYEAIAAILPDDPESGRDVDLDDVAVVGSDDDVARELKRRVGTDRGLYDIRLHNARVYRAVGDTIDNGARIRVKATGQLGTVRGKFETPQGPRYLVLYDLTPEQLQPLDHSPRPPVGQDYAADELEFLYVVRTGGWPEETPDWLRNLATSGA
jgi:hypothetical protein